MRLARLSAKLFDAELYVVGGYEMPKGAHSAGVEEKLRTAQRNLRVAEHSSPREQQKYADSAKEWLEQAACARLLEVSQQWELPDF